MREDESDEEDDDEEDENDEEEDEIEDNYTVEDLIIAAEELIPLLGDSLPVDTFLVYFSSYQRHLLKLLVRLDMISFRAAFSVCSWVNVVLWFCRKNIKLTKYANRPRLLSVYAPNISAVI